MKPLVLTEWLMPDFIENDLADLVLNFVFFDFVWGPQPSSDQLADHLGPRTDHDERELGGSHWSDWGTHRRKNRKHRNRSLAEFCQQYETVELWFDVRPGAQLKLIWLLDYFRSYPEIAGKLKLRLVDLDMNSLKNFGRWRPPVVDVAEKEFETASAAWQAYRSPTPEACFDLLSKDLSALPLLKPVLIDLLAELPSVSTGLGATEMRMLELIARGYSLTNALFHLYQLRQTRIFGEWQHGYLLDGLAFGPKPAVAGLDEELRKLDRSNLRDRHPAYLRSRLSLTEFGKAIVAHEEDFSRHNPIDRWWGGTHLTNDNLWRWTPTLVKPSYQSGRGVS
jgi:hypothetical protein